MGVERVVCPHLGTEGGRWGHLNRPHQAHRCWALGTPCALTRGQQARLCLNVAWARCPRLRPYPRASVLRRPREGKMWLLPAAALPPLGTPRPLVERHISPALWTATLGPFATALAVFTLLAWQTVGATPSKTATPRGAPAQVVKLPGATVSPGELPRLARASEPAVPAGGAPAVRAVRASPTPTSTPAPAPSPTRAPFIPLRSPVDADSSAPPAPTPIVTPGAFPPAATSPPDRILIPSIGVDDPVVTVGFSLVQEGPYLVKVYEVAEYAAGWHRDSALPGAVGNTVIAGHNNTKGEVFRDLYKLEPGDMVYISADGRWYPFRVAQKLLLREVGVPPEQQFENARWIEPTDDVRLTLVSCWPYATNTHRVIVVAVPDGSQG